MVGSRFIVVSDSQAFIQRARAFGHSCGADVEIYSTSEWALKMPRQNTLSSGSQTVVEGGAKILPFPGINSKENKKIQTIEELEGEAIGHAISQYNGNFTEAARALGIGRATLYRKVKQYNIDLDEIRSKRVA